MDADLFFRYPLGNEYHNKVFFFCQSLSCTSSYTGIRCENFISTTPPLPTTIASESTESTTKPAKETTATESATTTRKATKSLHVTDK